MTDDACLVAACGSYAVSRRRVLGGLMGAAGAGVATSLLGDVHRQVAFGNTSGNRNVLVVLSLRGGVDGLSLVVPHGDSAYAVARPRIGVPVGALLARDAMFGLHPLLAPLAPMWSSGTMAAVHAVGLPVPNRSHFDAIERIEDADPGSPERRGWINRLVGLEAFAPATDAIQLGSSTVSAALQGPAPVIGLRTLSDGALPGNPESEATYRASLETMWNGRQDSLGVGFSTALTSSRTLSPDRTTVPPDRLATYPKTDLARSLAEVATLVRADVGTRVVTLDHGGWDMHTGIGTPAWGAMRTQIDELARALAAFFADLGDQANLVTLATVSEFGRRVVENGSGGLDHGYGNCMLLLGAGVRGGQVHGQWPGLGADRLVDGDLAVTRDYRSVLSEILQARFPDVSRPAVFPDFTPESIGAVG